MWNRQLTRIHDLLTLSGRSGKKNRPKCLCVIWLVLCAANELESFKIYWDYLQLESCPFLAFIWGVFHIELYPSVRKDAGDEAYHHIVIITKNPDNTSILGAIFGDTTTSWFLTAN